MEQEPFTPPTSHPVVHWGSGLPFDPPVLPEPEIPPALPREPVVLPLAPRVGWARAGRFHRFLAVGSAPVVLAQLGLTLWAVLDRPGLPAGQTPQGTDAVGWLMLVSYLLGPPTFYAAARVLRPHVRRGGERAARHLVAATATALAVPVVTILAVEKVAGAPAAANLLSLVGVPPVLAPDNDNELAVLILLGLPAFLLGAVTLLWGTVAVVVRALAVDRTTSQRAQGPTS